MLVDMLWRLHVRVAKVVDLRRESRKRLLRRMLRRPVIRSEERKKGPSLLVNILRHERCHAAEVDSPLSIAQHQKQTMRLHPHPHCYQA